jgi:hypothetical protein
MQMQQLVPIAVLPFSWAVDVRCISTATAAAAAAAAVVPDMSATLDLSCAGSKTTCSSGIIIIIF